MDEPEDMWALEEALVSMESSPHAEIRQLADDLRWEIWALDKAARTWGVAGDVSISKEVGVK
jgi:hypothetical protein